MLDLLPRSSALWLMGVICMALQDEVRTGPWKELVSRLPGILGAAFTVDGETIREVHILSDQSRSPKQIVRDVQSVMMAGFQVELDHRVVSVAQVPGELAVTRDRLICDRLEVSTGRERVEVRVHLRCREHRSAGEASCEPASAGRLRAIVQATTAAIDRLLAPGHTFSVEEVRTTALGDRQVILAGLRLQTCGRSEPLLGACYVGSDPDLSAVLATLDGVNRRFSALPRALRENCSSLPL